MPVALGVNGGVLGSNNLPTATTFRGVFTPNEVARAIALGFWPVNKSQAVTGVAGTGALGTLTVGSNADPYFNLTTLLLSTTATNGAQNNIFQDSSTNNFTITRNGNTTQGTFSPFSQTGWGGAFNTSTTYLTVTDTANLRFGSSNFTIEAWVYRNASGATQTIASKGASTPTGWVFQISSADKLVFTDTSTSITGTTSIAANTWTYVAVVRAGTGANQTTLYVNGTSDGTGTSATNFNQTSNMLIGADRSTTNFANGYISNLRLSNTNRTISSTPTTALTADANTIFLSLNINRFQYTDSTAVLTNITATGTPSVVPFSPFNPTSAWSASTVGGSGYFDGTGDQLTIANNSAFDFGSGNFTVEAWCYFTGTSGSPINYSNGQTSNSNFAWDIYQNSATSIQTTIVQGSTGYSASSTALVANAWNHVACVRNGNTLTIYVNGVAGGTTANVTGVTANNPGGATVKISGFNNATGCITGYVSNARIVKGTAVYTSNFTPPTAPLTAITNTSLLLNFTNSGIYDATAKNVLETVGNAQASTAISAKWGSTSMYFDGTGDYLTSLNSTLYQFGTGDFAIEGWIYINSLSAAIALIDFRAANGATFGQIYITTGGVLRFYLPTDIGTSNSFSTGAWTFFAIARTAGTLNMYIGANRGYTGTYTSAMDGGALKIGADVNGGSGLNGYLQDLRFTKGYGRGYTGATITVPTAPFSVQ